VLCCAVLLQREFVREASAAPTLQYVPDFGYVSLFPLLMQLIPADSDILGQQLQLLQQQDLLWTQQGLRSLATTSSIYNKYVETHVLCCKCWCMTSIDSMAC
jgi:mannosyl-oligosaccharide glucosidase